MAIRILPVIFFLLVTYTAQANNQQEVIRVLQQVLEDTNAPSLSVAVGQDGELVVAAAVGLANIQDATPATVHTQYRTGSVAKVIGTTAFMTLVDKGQVSVRHKIRDYLPYLPRSYNDITLEHLLTHTSGIRHYRFGEYGTNIHYPTLQHATQVFKDSALEFAPGQGYQYTTYGINLIQGVIEHVAGTPLEQFMVKALFNKANMTQTELEVADRARPDYATGYKAYFDSPVKDIDVSNKYIGGGMRTTPSDLVKMLAAINSETLLTARTRAQMFTAPFPDVASQRALGWRTYRYKNMNGIGHSGAINGFESFLLHLFDVDLTVAFMVNKDHYDHTSSTLYQVADLFLNQQKQSGEKSLGKAG